MKNITIGLIVLAIVVLGAFYVYKIYLVDELSEAIINEEIPGVVPKDLRSDVTKLRNRLGEDSDALAKYLHKNEVDLENFNAIIDNLEYREVEKFVDMKTAGEFETSEQAFEYVVQNFDFEEINVRNFESDFKEYYESEKFDQTFDFFSKNKDQMKLLFPVGKETMKKLLREKYHEENSAAQ